MFGHVTPLQRGWPWYFILGAATPHVHPVPKDLVYRLAYNGDVAAGQLAVFQGASDEHI